MGRSRLTPRPSAPALVQAAALGTLFAAGCGDDGSTGTTDQHPTALCAHSPDDPQCEATGTSTTSDDATSTGTATGGGTATSTTGMTTATDAHPTTPCAHDPDAPGCGSSSGADTTGTGSTGGTAGSTGGSGSSTSG